MRLLISLLVILFLFLATENHAQVINAGIGGNSTAQLLRRIDMDVINQNPDITILMVGTNDMLNSRKMISYQEYSDNLNRIVAKLKVEGIQVLLMSSPPVDSTYLFMRHDKRLFKQAPNEIMDSVSHIVEKIAAKNDVLFLNLFDKFNSLGLPKHNEDLFFRNEKNSSVKDGVHPTSLGYHFIAANVFQLLKRNKVLIADVKIICFGDSITNGAGSKGDGTVSGENYPSFLSYKINDYLME